MDCVSVNHCPVVYETFRKNNITVIPSSGRGHEVKNGSPPTSHDTSILDGNLFATLQTEASAKTLALKPSKKQSRVCQLMDVTKRIWASDLYKSRAAGAVLKLENVLHDIVKENGGPTGR